jgi:hypothetical protein
VPLGVTTKMITREPMSVLAVATGAKRGRLSFLLSSKKIHLSSGETGVNEVRLSGVSMGQVLLNLALPAASGLRHV